MSEKVQARLNQIKSLIELEPFQHSATELADRFDISDNTIRVMVRKNNLNLAHHINADLPKIKRFIRDNSFMTASQIGRKLKQEPVYIANLATRIGVVLANRGRKSIEKDPKFFNYLIHGLAY